MSKNMLKIVPPINNDLYVSFMVRYPDTKCDDGSIIESFVETNIIKFNNDTFNSMFKNSFNDKVNYFELKSFYVKQKLNICCLPYTEDEMYRMIENVGICSLIYEV